MPIQVFLHLFLKRHIWKPEFQPGEHEGYFQGYPPQVSSMALSWQDETHGQLLVI